MCSDCPFNSGMCFPKGEYYCECPSCNIQGSKITRAMDEDCRHPDCPLVELPEKHGDLIDRQLLEQNVLKWMPNDPCGIEEHERPFETDICVSMMMEIEEQPIVIEAEGGK